MLTVLLLLIVGFVLFFEYCKSRRSYWQNRNVICLEDKFDWVSFVKLIWRKLTSIEEEIEEIYAEFKKHGIKHGGSYIFIEPVYIPVDISFLQVVLENKSISEIWCPELYSSQGDLIREIPLQDLQLLLSKVDVKSLIERSSKVKIGIESFIELFFQEFENLIITEQQQRERRNRRRKYLKETLCRCVEEIAKRPIVKKELNSLFNTKQTGLRSNEQYLTGVILETIRLYPTVPFLKKQCLEPIDIPGTDVTLEKGTTVLIAISQIHKDSYYFEDPDYFEPQRFLKDRLKPMAKYTFWNFYDEKEIEFLRRSLEVLTKNGFFEMV